MSLGGDGMSTLGVIRENTRSDVIDLLTNLYKQGYMYVLRNKNMPYLICFSLKPKRYLDTESWGYVNPDAVGALPAYPIKNTSITEINYSNKSATLITDLIKIM